MVRPVVGAGSRRLHQMLPVDSQIVKLYSTEDLFDSADSSAIDTFFAGGYGVYWLCTGQGC